MKQRFEANMAKLRFDAKWWVIRVLYHSPYFSVCLKQGLTNYSSWAKSVHCPFLSGLELRMILYYSRIILFKKGEKDGYVTDFVTRET